MSYAPIDPTNAVILFANLQTGIVERSASNDVARLELIDLRAFVNWSLLFGS
jgi:hypothetical protein